VVATFVAGFLGAVSLDLTNITDLGWKAWLIAGAGAGVVSVLKGLAARLKGSTFSASLASEVGPQVLRVTAPAPTDQPQGPTSP
jgi:hypothetical protein